MIRTLIRALAVSAALCSAQALAAPQVQAPAGTLKGEVLADGIHAFRGIPYAQAPVGALR